MIDLDAVRISGDLGTSSALVAEARFVDQGKDKILANIERSQRCLRDGFCYATINDTEK